MHNVTIYHNPRCSNSRGALKILGEWGVAPHVIEYLHTPLEAGTLRALFDAYDGPASDFIRFKEAAAQDSGLSRESNADSIARAIVINPILLQRPVVVFSGCVLIARPPESLLPALKAANLAPPSET